MYYFFQSCVWIGLYAFHRSLYLFHSQNSHRSSDPSNFNTLKILEWLCFQMLLWCDQPSFCVTREKEEWKVSCIFSSKPYIFLFMWLYVCIFVFRAEIVFKMNADWQRKEGLSGGPTWPTFIKTMMKMRTDVKEGSGIFRDICSAHCFCG